jgi:hypothetical protein
MKQKTLILALLGGFVVLSLSSYESGPLANGAGNRTGSAGSSGNCSSGGCHASNTTVTVPTITITEGSSSTPVTSYTSGKTYTVHIGGTCSASGMSRFGFQLSTVLASNTSAQAGTLTATGASTAVRTTGSLQIVEHTASIAGTGSGSSWSYATTAQWVAPHFGSGDVKFYLTLNAVNNNGSESGDKPNNAVFTFSESTVGIANISFAQGAKVYPNPTTGTINVYEENAANGNWDIIVYNLYGSKVYSQQVSVTTGTLSANVNSASWAPGIYQLQIAKDGMQKCIPVIKQ